MDGLLKALVLETVQHADLQQRQGKTMMGADTRFHSETEIRVQTSRKKDRRTIMGPISTAATYCSLGRAAIQPPMV